MKKNILFAAAILMALLFNACKPENKTDGEKQEKTSTPAGLEALIPKNVQTIASLNAIDLLQQFGCTVTDSSVTPTPQLEKLFIPRFIELVAKLTPAVNLDNIYIFTPDGDNIFMLAQATHPDAVKKALTDSDMEHSVQQPYDVYKSPKLGNWFIKDDIIWCTLSGASATPADISKMVETNGSLASLQFLCDYLKNPQLLKTASSIPGSTELWICSDSRGHDSSLETTVDIYDNTGKLVKYTALKDIDTSFLALVPRQTLFLAAAGIPAGFDWNPVGNVIKENGGFELSLIYEVLQPVLRSIDGTVAIAVESPRSISSINNVKAIFMAQMDQQNGLKAVEIIGKLLKRFEIPFTEKSSSELIVRFMGMSVYFIYSDGYLIISTYRPTPDSNIEIPGYFINARIAATIDISRQWLYRMVGIQPDYDIDFTLSADTDTMVMDLTLVNEKLPFLQAIVNTIYNELYASR